MNFLERQAMWNSATLVAKLKPGESITREDLIDALRRPLPVLGIYDRPSDDRPSDDMPSDREIFHAFQYYVIQDGIKNTEELLTYKEAARISETSADALRQAARRGRLIRQYFYRYGYKRAGIPLKSLAEYKGWDHDQFQAAAEQVAKWRKTD